MSLFSSATGSGTDHRRPSQVDRKRSVPLSSLAGRTKTIAVPFGENAASSLEFAALMLSDSSESGAVVLSLKRFCFGSCHRTLRTLFCSTPIVSPDSSAKYAHTSALSFFHMTEERPAKTARQMNAKRKRPFLPFILCLFFLPELIIRNASWRLLFWPRRYCPKRPGPS